MPRGRKPGSKSTVKKITKPVKPVRPEAEKAKNYRLSLAEQETTIGYDKSSDECNIYTANPFEIRAFKKMVAEGKDIVLIEETEWSCRFRTSKKNIKIRFKREMTEEQVKKMSERMKKTSAKIWGKDEEDEDESYGEEEV